MNFNASTLNRGSFIKGDSIIYHITDVLGQGSFGITYKATIKTLAKGAFGEDWVDTNTPKAIKEFFMSDINSRDYSGAVQGFIQGGISSYYAQKFYKEARNLAKLNHPNIVKVTDFIEANGTYYYVMDYIEGDNLNHYIEKYVLSEKEAISIINDVASALQYMHEEHKMLHLDMKPSNIMRSKDGHIYVIDFGLSKHYNEQGEPDTSTTVGYGTIGYAPLEQGNKTQKSNDFFPTIDVYALGGTFFKLLTGETPPPSAEVLNDETLLSSIMEHHHVSPGLQKIVISAMAPLSKLRIQSVREFRNALNNYMRETKLFDSPDEIEVTAVLPPESQVPPVEPKVSNKFLKDIILALVIAIVTVGVIALAKSCDQTESNNPTSIQTDSTFARDGVVEIENVKSDSVDDDYDRLAADKDEVPSSNNMTAEEYYKYYQKQQQSKNEDRREMEEQIQRMAENIPEDEGDDPPAADKDEVPSGLVTNMTVEEYAKYKKQQQSKNKNKLPVKRAH